MAAKKSPAAISGSERQVIEERPAPGEIGRWSQSAETAEFVDEMRLIVVTAGDRRVRPIDGRLMSDPINGALEGTDARKSFRPEADTAIEFAQQMFVTEADLTGDLSDADCIAAAPNDIERITHCTRWLGPSAHSCEQPCFNKREAGVVITRFAEIIAEPIDLAAEDGVQFHDTSGKLTERQTKERPGATRPQTHSDEMDFAAFINDDGRHAFPGNPTVPEGSGARMIVRIAELLRVAEVDNQLHGAIGQDHVPPKRRKPAARDPEMLDASSEKRRDGVDAMKKHGEI
jgi:hypothetical protein